MCQPIGIASPRQAFHEAKWPSRRNTPETNHRQLCRVVVKQEEDMTAYTARLSPKTTTEAAVGFQTFVSVALFSGVGLLVSVSVLLLDKYIPGDWF